jgi:hypothetical protein
VGGLAVDWLPAGTLAVAGDSGVSIYARGSDTPPQKIVDADGLVVPRATVRCQPLPPPPDEIPDDDTAEP